MRSNRFFFIATALVFVVIFNVGFVFHEILAKAYFARAEAAIARDEIIVPLVAVAFLVYCALLAHFFPSYRRAYPQQSTWAVGVRFGLLMGVLFDALQGGLIEVATFKMPFEVFAVDSGYHVLFEGTLAGLVLAFAYNRWGQPRPA